MSIDVTIQNQIHGQVERLSGDAPETLTEIVLDAPIGSMMRGIHKYADTMFNSYQLTFFLDELAAMTPRNVREEEMIATLRAAAESAIRINGYLWFSGD